MARKFIDVTEIVTDEGIESEQPLSISVNSIVEIAPWGDEAGRCRVKVLENEHCVKGNWKDFGFFIKSIGEIDFYLYKEV